MEDTWVSSGVLLNMIGLGMVLSFPTCLLPALASPESDIQTNLDTASWLASSIGLAMGPGCVVSWLLMDRYGRRTAYMLLMLPSILGWMFIYFASNVPTLMVGRIFNGFTCGCSVNLGATIIGEYTSPRLRGVFLILKTAAICVGNIILHILGNFLHWRTVAIYGIVVNLTPLLIIFTLPESPAWLASKQRFEASAKSFYFLRGNDEESKKELEELFGAQKKNVKVNYFKGIGKKIVQKNFRKPFLITFFANMVMEFSGRHFFPAYATQIVEEVFGGKSLYVVTGIDAMAVVGVAVAALLARTVGRRILLLSSAASALVVLIMFCLYQLLCSYQLIPNYPVISIALLIVYFILTNIGCSPIPLALVGEIFPLAHRGTGPALLGIVMALFMMVVLKVAPLLMATVKVYGMFAVFGAATAGSTVVVYFILPETKDKTLQQIEDYFKNGYFLENVRKEEKRIIAHA